MRTRNKLITTTALTAVALMAAATSRLGSHHRRHGQGVRRQG